MLDVSILERSRKCISNPSTGKIGNNVIQKVEPTGFRISTEELPNKRMQSDKGHAALAFARSS